MRNTVVPHLRTGDLRAESLAAGGTAEGRGPTGRGSAFSFFRDPAMDCAPCVYALSQLNEQPVKWIRQPHCDSLGLARWISNGRSRSQVVGFPGRGPRHGP
ncbi:uncharacterized protein CCOS01_09973 [Colletotrichum costaricense]|uniref:Uncharacterized protein n=1 Tax=Colletotrichum costaricense TaxID=1209916 RepID=A0AAJ0DY88_9PEZI|nr:uncharacterized protein CCOS01_09973 [Colletotrichum costaricense]KAK1522261.1 hypothetical protein CCOS01_09973 [Colletotrichum costaricense]